MGEEIASTDFDAEDYARFSAALNDETRLLGDWFAGGALSEAGYTWGYEVEAWLLDHAYFPNPVNEPLLAALDDPDVVPELSRFNVELNTPPRVFETGTFSEAADGLSRVLAHCNRVAHGLDTNIVTIGTLPTIREADLSLEHISPLKRYYALNDEVLRKRGGAPLEIAIDGEDRLRTRHRDVMLEAAATSLQVHLKVPASLAHRYYNASLAVSAPILAACVNAPLLFGRRLWDETRIPLFEQSVSLGQARIGPARVTFGTGYLGDSLFEAFEENLADYGVLLPYGFDDAPAALRHLRLHNGTIWRWNRPLVQPEPGGGAHVRIEHRVLPAGPSTLDMIANTAFYLGLVHDWVHHDRLADTGLGFEAARVNFYAAARHGLAAQLARGERTVTAAQWLLEELLSQAASGLAALGVDAADVERFLGIVTARVKAGATGAAWQRARWAANGGDAFELMAAYCERQRSGAPVHEWPA